MLSSLYLCICVCVFVCLYVLVYDCLCVRVEVCFKESQMGYREKVQLLKSGNIEDPQRVAGRLVGV